MVSEPRVVKGVWVMSAGGGTAVLTFVASLYTGFAIATDPGSFDTGVAVVLVSPCYGVVALLAGTAVGLFVALMPKRPLLSLSLSRWRRWLSPLMLAGLTGLAVLIGLIRLMHSLTRFDPLSPVVGAPLWVFVALGAGVVMFRLLRPAARQPRFTGERKDD